MLAWLKSLGTGWGRRLDHSGDGSCGAMRQHHIAATASTPRLLHAALGQWSIDVLRLMDWKRYEEVSAAYFALTTESSHTTSIGPASGLDVRMFQCQAGHPYALARCTALHFHRINAQPILTLAHALARQQIERGLFVSRAGFRSDAHQAASRYGIALIDGVMLLSMIQRLRPAFRDHLLAIATAGDWRVPSCPLCGEKMLGRQRDSSVYWRCSSLERCNTRLPPTPNDIGTLLAAHGDARSHFPPEPGHNLS